MPQVIQRKVTVSLDDHEVAVKAAEMAALMDQIEAVTEEKKAKAAEFKSTLDALRKGLGELKAVVRLRQEDRVCDCTYVKDYKRGVITFFRSATGEEVGFRSMTEEERQRALLDDDDVVTGDADEVISKISAGIPARADEDEDESEDHAA